MAQQEETAGKAFSGPPSTARPRPRRPWRTVALSIAGLFVISVGVIVIALISRPAWYRPPEILSDQLQNIRNRLTDANLEFSRLLVLGEPFSFEIDCRDLTEWLNARVDIYPESKRWLPRFADHPVVAADHDRLHFGMRLVEGPYHGIANGSASVAVTPSTIRIKVERIRGGNFPLPMRTLLTPVADWINGKSADVSRIHKDLQPLMEAIRGGNAEALIHRGIAVENRFVYPDGDIPFTIRQCRFAGNKICLEIEPL